MLEMVVGAVIMSDCQDNYFSICFCLALLHTFSLENPVSGARVVPREGELNSALVIHTSRRAFFSLSASHSVNATSLYLDFNAENTLVSTTSRWL